MTLAEQIDNMTMCFYVPGDTRIVDMARNTGRSLYQHETLEEIRTRYPGAELMPFEDACEQIDKARHASYKVGQAQEITEERFIEMLEVLPPKQWKRAGHTESFKMAELLDGDITGCYARIGNRYFQVNGSISATHDWIIAACQSCVDN